MKKLFSFLMIGLACALNLSAAELNIYASGLKAGDVKDGKVEISYVLNAPATAVEVQLLNGETVAATLPITGDENLTKGAHTVTVDLAGVAGGTYTWAVKASAAATTELALVNDLADSAYQYYGPRGLAVNYYPETEGFGTIWVNCPLKGADDGSTDYVKHSLAGVFNYNALLERNSYTPYLGGLTWPNAADGLHRLAVGTDGNVYASASNANLAGIWMIDAANPAANFVPMVDQAKKGETFNGFSGLTVEGEGADRVIYALENISTTGGALVKIPVGAGSNYANALDTLYVNGGTADASIVCHIAGFNNNIATDGRGGFWIVQHRWGADAWPAVFHISDKGALDFAVNDATTKDKYLPFTANISYRGAMGLNADKTLLAMSSDKSIVVFQISYDAAGVPDLKELYRTPALAGNVDGAAFDYANNLYVISAGSERFYVYSPANADNTCTTPAPTKNTISVEGGAAAATVVYDWATEVGTTVFGGSTKKGSVKIHLNKDSKDCVVFANGYTQNNVPTNYMAITCDGGFKKGDILSIAGCYNNSDNTGAKYASARIYANDRLTMLDSTLYVVNSRFEEGDPAAETFTLAANQDTLFIGRQGNTGLNLLQVTVTRPAAGQATGYTLTYELNGGVTNDYGWTNKGDMFTSFMTTANPNNKFETLDYYMKQADPLSAPNICTNLVNPEVAFADSAKWGWLYNYIISVSDAQRAVETDISAYPATGAGAAWRYAVGAFFCSMQRTGWPKSADFTTAGQDAAYIPVWGHAYAGPAAYDGTEDIVIPTPYREGFTFDGWYETADFSGSKVTTIAAGSEGNKTLYAKWVEYIPTAEEIWANGNVDTKFKGVVTFVNGRNVYIQDATAGLYLYLKKADDTLQPGMEVIGKGTATIYNGQFEINNAEIESKETVGLPTPKNAIIGNVLANMKDFMYQYVHFEGVRVINKDDSLMLSDGVSNIYMFKVITDTAAVLNKKVNADLTVCNYGYKLNEFGGNVQLKGYEANVTLAPLGGLDPYSYPARGENDAYTLTNDWLISSVLDNFAANKPAQDGYARNMAVKDGIMYFADRQNAQLVRVDGKTSEMLEAVPLASNLFTYTVNEGTDSVKTENVGFPYNDIHFDNAGNLVAGNLMASKGIFQAWKIDPATGEGTVLIHEDLRANPDYEKIESMRFDAFGVYGDVNGNAIIMAQNVNGWQAFKWEITNGVASEAEMIEEIVKNDSLLKDLSQPSYAPRIYPVDENYFYIDGFNTLPTLFEMGGSWVDGFQNNYALMNIANNPGDTCILQTGVNGLAEFQIGDEYFLVMGATGRAGVPNSAFAIYKFKDANKEFKDMTPLWYFPADGMGPNTNSAYNGLPVVEVEGNKAKIYVYMEANGYGVYTLTSANASGIDENNARGTLTISMDGALSETVANAQVYNMAGQLIFAGQNVRRIEGIMTGAYILRAQKMDGTMETVKFLAK